MDPLIAYFPQSVPHMQYQKLVMRATPDGVANIARVLWCRWGLVLKKVSRDKHIRFGLHMMPEDTIRKLMTLLGSFQSRVTLRQQQCSEQEYIFTYDHRECAIVCHNTVFETSFGDVRVRGQHDPELENIMKQSLYQPDEREEEEDADWWKWEVGKLMGSEEAHAGEETRLTASKLAPLSRA